MKSASVRKVTMLFGASGFLITTCMVGSQLTAHAQGKKVVTITEEDYYTNSSQSVPMNALIASFEKSHPNIKISRTAVPYPELLPKSLQQTTTHSLPTILVTDNLNIPTMAAAGALLPLHKVGAINTKDYLRGPMTTVTYQGQLYGLPVGNNDLALYYNKAMLKKAHVSPPRTWAQLLTVAKKLSHGSTYGFVFSAPSNEQATWQFAPFLWSNGGTYQQFDSKASIQALSLWTNLVKEGGASKSVVNFSQTDVYNEFAAGRAAMMEMGPWMIPSLKSTHISYGVVPLPTPKAGEWPQSPIGGEAWTVTTDGSSVQQKAALTFIKWVQQKSVLVKFDENFGYIPAYIPAMKEFVKENPQYSVFSKQLQHSKALFTGLKDQLPNVSTAAATAIQQALTGSATPAQAAKTASSAIATALK